MISEIFDFVSLVVPFWNDVFVTLFLTPLSDFNNVPILGDLWVSLLQSLGWGNYSLITVITIHVVFIYIVFTILKFFKDTLLP